MKVGNDKIRLAYGRGEFILSLRDLPDRPTILEREEPPPLPDPAQAVSQALEAPVGALPLRRLVKRGQKVLILVSDLTRETGASVFMPVLLGALNSAGIADQDISVMFTLGLHKPNTPEEKRRIVGETVAARLRLLDNDANNEAAYTFVGTTSFKNNVLIHRLAMEADRLILTGSIGYHLFAGFGGGRKAVMPGVSFRKTILYNHMLTLTTRERGWHPCARPGVLKDNPVHLDMVEAARMARPAFLLNTVLDSRHRMVKVFAGDPFTAFETGCEYFDRHYSLPVRERADLVIVSCGGFPKDINFIQSHKTIDYAMNVLREGGVMIVLAECLAGLGNDTFLDWFKYATCEEFEEGLKETYLQIEGGMNAQTAYSLFCKTQRATILLVSALPAEWVREMGMLPAPSLEAALTLAKQRLRRDFSVHVIPAGGYLRLYVP